MYRTLLLVFIHLFLLIGTNFAAEISTPVMKQTIVARQPQIEKQYPSVIIYTLSTCPHCMEAKQYMKDNNIPFVNREVDMDAAHMAELMKIYDSMGVPDEKRGVPLLVIGDKIRLQGFNKEKFETAIKEAIKNESK